MINKGFNDKGWVVTQRLAKKMPVRREIGLGQRFGESLSLLILPLVDKSLKLFEVSEPLLGSGGGE